MKISAPDPALRHRYLPKRPESPPQALIEPAEAEVISRMYRLLVEEQLSCRLITRHLNQAHVPPPRPNHPVWHPSTVRNILTNHTYMGRARFNYRRSGCPQEPGPKLHPESEWVWTQAPAIISAELFAQAQEQLRRNAELARRMYKPSGRRYLLRRLVKCGQCGLGMLALHRALNAKVYHYDYYACKGRAPLVCGRPSACVARLVRADQLDELVWQALCQLLGDPKAVGR